MPVRGRWFESSYPIYDPVISTYPTVMGTNYYLHFTQPAACSCCGHEEKVHDLHIGKQSAGWRFSFHGVKELELTSWKAWKKFLRQAISVWGVFIVDEYGDMVPLMKFTEIVESTKHLKSHALLYPQGCWSDDEGHSFDGGEFS